MALIITTQGNVLIMQTTGKLKEGPCIDFAKRDFKRTFVEVGLLSVDVSMTSDTDFLQARTKMISVSI